MSQPTDSKGRPIHPGDTIFWVERGTGEELVGTVVADERHEGGLAVRGCSLSAIMDDAIRITVIR